MTSGRVISRDGTPIGYLKTGHGPAIVIMHGSMESARSHTLLAQALADEFTVYLPDRRGRGMSGPHRPGHSVRTEVEDLQAVLAESGGQLAFGVSAGGLIVLEAARTLTDLRKIAVYEPALVADAAPHLAWLKRFDQEMASGDVAAAMITSMYGLHLAPPFLKVLPRRLLASVTEKAMKSEDRKAAPDDITMRKLAPTIHYEGALIAEMAGTADAFRAVTADVLLMGGSKGLPFLTACPRCAGGDPAAQPARGVPRAGPRRHQRSQPDQPGRQARDRRARRPRDPVILRRARRVVPGLTPAATITTITNLSDLRCRPLPVTLARRHFSAGSPPATLRGSDHVFP